MALRRDRVEVLLSEIFKQGQVWLWAQQHHCMLIRYVSYNWAECHEVWDVLDLDSSEAGRICRGFLYVSDGDLKWQPIA